MISHVFIGVNDFNRALVFYQGVMEILGLDLKFTDFERSWAGWKHPDTARPLFVVGKPFDSQSATLGNGQMIALLAPNRQIVRNAHALALVLDGTCEGTPGLRPEYHPNFYGAYFRDPEGNKLCVCCHDPE
ncbi:VOC family protein [Pseudomonas sp. FP2196]|uniref:VOC family protein n=1 Tax=Pseudomonas sp. FP2196 TaxID=2954086 RepID=UPI0027325E94|nr:VOC family protein [Pseudomonas sp. FP2196]WLH37990.1 VOC family protein [Pseudomonas sp. FP2196]